MRRQKKSIFGYFGQFLGNEVGLKSHHFFFGWGAGEEGENNVLGKLEVSL